MTLTLAACAQTGDDSGAPGGASPDRWAAFHQRADEVAQAWLDRADPKGWRDGYVPLQHPTVLVGEPTFTEDTKQAFAAGWYRHQVELPPTDPAEGTIRFPDGTLDVPLLSAAEAYRELDQGDPPPCVRRPASPPDATGTASPGGPDTPVGSDAGSSCVPLTVTGVELGTVALRTSRGEAQVPAWLFSIEEVDGTVARVAVDPSAAGELPDPVAPANPPATDLVSAQDLTGVDGTTLHYRLGVGACDVDITPLVREAEDVVVVGGGVTRSPGVCTEQLVIKPVSVTLDAPLGDRPVLDAVTGQPLTFVPTP